MSRASQPDGGKNKGIDQTQGRVAFAHCRELRKQGFSQRLIAEMTGLSPSVVRYHTRDIEVVTTQKRPYLRYSRQEAVKTLEPSLDLAYFWGVFAGDGSLSRQPRTFKLAIACDPRYPDLIKTYTDLMERLTGRMPTVSLSSCNYMRIVLYGQVLPELFGLPYGRKTDNGFTVPEWIFENRDYTAFCLRGLIETDGGIYKRHRIEKGRTWECIFTAYNVVIMEAFLRAADLLGFRFHCKGNRASLSNTEEVRRLMAECQIQKCCDYENTGV